MRHPPPAREINEGGWTGSDSGAPNAFGYIDLSDTGSVYIAPNITFDFTEIQCDNKTPAQADADWESLFNFIAYAYNAGYEFVTSEDLASRIAAEQAATLCETTNGNVITATVTPAPQHPTSARWR